MHPRVVGLMESWRGRGRGRQAGRDALARLATAWKAGSDPGGPALESPDGLVGPGRSGGKLNGAAVAVPAGQQEQARADVPDRREGTAEHNRVPGVLAGIAGAVITRAVPELRRRDPASGGP